MAAALLDELEGALAGDEWPPRGALRWPRRAAAAAATPNARLDARLAERGGADCGRGPCVTPGSHTVRFAVRAMSHLRALTPEALAALQAAAGDLAPVQRQAIAATGNFRHLATGFDVDAALAELDAALHGPSTCGASDRRSRRGSAARRRPARRRVCASVSRRCSPPPTPCAGCCSARSICWIAPIVSLSTAR